MNDVKREIEAIVTSIDRRMKRYGDQFPHLSFDGSYSQSLIQDGSWTGSFWTGMIYLAHCVQPKSAYIDGLRRYLPVYEHRLTDGYLDHDTGFLYQLYAVLLYKLTGDAAAKRLIVGAADALLARFNRRGSFIRAWGELDNAERSGKMIIDCMLNLPLLFNASRITGNPAYREAADAHAWSAMQHHIRPDDSTHHTFDFDPESGRPIGGFNEGGYSDDSTWARGQAWGIYGFALAYRHTGREAYAEAAYRLARYFVRHLPADRLPFWDFGLPDTAGAPRDASAAAIAACGMLEMHRLTGESNGAWAPLKREAEDMLNTLRASCSTASDGSAEGLLMRSFGRVGGKEQELFAIWGDYYYMEGLLMQAGLQPDAWYCT